MTDTNEQDLVAPFVELLRLLNVSTRRKEIAQMFLLLSKEGSDPELKAVMLAVACSVAWVEGHFLAETFAPFEADLNEGEPDGAA